MLDPLLTIFSVALAASIISNGLYKLMIDEAEVMALREQAKKLGNRLRSGKIRSLEEEEELRRELVKVSSRMMAITYKPMMLSFPIWIGFFFWLKSMYSGIYVAEVPSLLTRIFPLFKEQLGWLGWYIICSFPLSILTRRLMGIKL